MYVLQKETSITYSDIFGRQITYTETVKDSDAGWFKSILGNDTIEIEKTGRTPGMRAQTLQAYIELMNEHNQRVKQQNRKGKMRQKMKKNKLGF